MNGAAIMTAIPDQRLMNQGLVSTGFTSPAEVIAWMGVVQAQDYAGAKWALGLRIAGATDDMIERAFAEGSILRTHVLRPTWHFVTPANIRWMLDLTGPRVKASMMSYYRQHDLGDAVFAQSNDVLARALEGGKHLTRAELGAALAAAGIRADDAMRVAFMVGQAELDGVVCSGPRRGKQHTYALLAERAPNARRLGHDEALAELARRYFTSHGPATVQDYVWWSGLTSTDARTGLELVRSELVEDEIDGQTYWLSPSTPAANVAAGTTFLLPVYDEYAVAYKDRSAILDPAYAEASGNGIFSSPILMHGRVAGIWKRTFRKDSVVIEAEPFVPFSPAEWDAFAAAAARYGDFLGLPVVLA
jgi:ribosomal protein S18 acetylase RimI-like enzyme